jgi:chorismate mutase
MGVAYLGWLRSRIFFRNQIRIYFMAKITFEIDADDDNMLRLLAHRHEIIAAIQGLTMLRWKHIETVDEAREQVANCLDGLYELFD